MTAPMALPGKDLSGAATPRLFGRSILASLVLHGVAIGGGLAWLKPWELVASGPRFQAHVTMAEPTEEVGQSRIEPERQPILPAEPADPPARELPTEPAPPTLEPEPQVDPIPDGEWRLARLARRRPILRIEPLRPEPAVVAALAAPPTPAAAAESGAVAKTAAVPLRCPSPRYPPASVRLGEEGSLLVEIRVARDGRVRSVAVIESSGYVRLDEAALEAVGSWRFEPATRAGIAVETVYPHRLTFRLAHAIQGPAQE